MLRASEGSRQLRTEGYRGPEPTQNPRPLVPRFELLGSAAAGRFDPARSDLDFLVELQDANGADSREPHLTGGETAWVRAASSPTWGGAVPRPGDRAP